MKKIFKKNLILSIFALCFVSQGAMCSTLSNAELKNIIYQKVDAIVKTQVTEYSPDYKITISGILNGDITTNEISLPSVEIQSQSSQFQPNFYRRVLIKDSKNEIIKSFPISVNVSIYKNVLCAKENIAYLGQLNAQNTQLERRDISKYLDKTLTTLEENTVSKRNYQKGSIILKDGIKSHTVVLKDSTIEIVFVSPKGLNIRMQGRALKEGTIGEKILVRSDKYNKIYTATVNSANEVIVRI